MRVGACAMRAAEVTKPLPSLAERGVATRDNVCLSYLLGLSDTPLFSTKYLYSISSTVTAHG